MLLARISFALSLVTLVIAISTVAEAVRPPATAAGGTLLLRGGTARLQRAVGGVPRPVMGGEWVFPGDRLSTGPKGQLVVEFPGGEESWIGPATSAVVISAGRPASGGFRVGLGAGLAGAWASMVRLAGFAASPTTGPAVATVEVRGEAQMGLTIPAPAGVPGVSARIPGCRRT